ncbi:MAG: endonuclease III [Bacteroidales bacterium]|jgi:endonuclease-3|nr:endonuclease III [Bacteroidales bacterium]
MTTQERYNRIIEYFTRTMPAPETELHYADPFQLLVAVILSAQCTDKRVNMVTPDLFRRFASPQQMAAAEPAEVYDYIKSVSYPNNKAKHLVGMAKMLVAEFGGIVPDDVEQLQRLPGVGRKTANVIAAVVYNRPAFAVDTHVFRVAARLGLAVDSKTPLETERQLTANFPAELIPDAHHWLILHGRYTCKAKTPDCQACGLSDICVWYSHQKK